MRIARLAWRFLRRDWRAGELRVLWLALVIAVGSVTAVGFFTDRIQRALEFQAGELLAADLVLAGNSEPDAAWSAQAAQRGLRVVRTLGFRSMVTGAHGLQLAEIKAVQPGYPLRGRLRIADAPAAADYAAPGIPPPGTVWADAQLLRRLGAQPGDVVGVGKARLRIDKALILEPDRGGDLFSIAPRLLMNLDDVPATELVQPTSQVSHRLLMAGTPQAVDGYRDWARPRLAVSQNLLRAGEERPEIKQALERAQRYLSLAALVSVLVAGVAVATAVRRYTQRHLDSAALLRCLGAGQRDVLWLYLFQLIWLGVLAAIAGCALGYLAQGVLARILGGLFHAALLPPPSLLPALSGLAVGLITLFGFALPPLLQVRSVPPLRMLRRDMPLAPPRAWIIYGTAGAAMAALMIWQARDLLLTAYLLGGTLLALLVLSGGAWLLVHALAPLRRGRGVAWRFGLLNIVRRARTSVLLVASFGLGLMVLLVLALVRADLLEGWRNSLPPDAPNQFLINIQAQQVEPLRAFLAQRHITPELYPMVRGRLVEHNGRPVRAEDFPELRAQRLVQREFNLSWAQQIAPDNQVIAGRFWKANPAPPQWSVEQGLAETLGIKSGDEIGFLVAGELVKARVSSLRRVAWDSFRVNFFVIGTPSMLDADQASYITSFHLPAADKPLLDELVRAFPNISVIDVDAIMTKVREIIERVNLAVEFVFLFTLLAGLMVLYAAVQTTRDERLREGAVLRVLGASAGQVRAALVAEFTVLGVLAGLLASLLASAQGYILAEQVFGFPYAPDPRLWLAGILGGAAGLGVAGYLGTRNVLKQAPMRVLRGV